jgi:hypothetical protein
LPANNKFGVPTIWVDSEESDIYILARNEYIGGVRTAEWVKVGNDTGEVEGFKPDAFTPPGTDPVLPISIGGIQLISITGGQVAAGTTSNVIRSNSLAANTVTIEVQRASAQSVSTVGSNGVSHFNSTDFSVDSNGFVSLSGGGPAIDSFIPDTGTSPVIPDASGQVSIRGQVAPGVSGIQVTGGTNALNISMASGFLGDFTFYKAAAGATVSLISSQTNAANTSSHAVVASSTVGGGGNPFIGCTVSATKFYSWGIIQSDSNSFQLLSASNSTLTSGAILWRMSEAGIQTLPLQSSFHATLSTTQTNTTGDGTDYLVPFNTVDFDQANNYNNTTYTFTAPSAGDYLAISKLILKNVNSSHTEALGFFTLNGSTTVGYSLVNPSATRTPGNAVYITGSNVFKLSAGDTVSSHLVVYNSTKTVSVSGLSDGDYTYFTMVKLV